MNDDDEDDYIPLMRDPFAVERAHTERLRVMFDPAENEPWWVGQCGDPENHGRRGHNCKEN